MQVLLEGSTALRRIRNHRVGVASSLSKMRSKDWLSRCLRRYISGPADDVKFTVLYTQKQLELHSVERIALSGPNSSH